MALETGTFISDLVATNPTGSDPLAFADDHLRLLKSTLKNTFPNVTGAVSKTHTEINTAVDQAAAALPKAGGTLTGPLVLAAAPTVTLGAATKGYVDSLVDAHTVSTAQIEDGAVTTGKIAANAVTEAKLASGVAAANLGFNPVQQGTGTGQLGNSVKIGWSGTQLKAQVDATDMGAFVMQSAFTDHSLSGNGYQKLPGGLIVQWGSYNNPASTTSITLPIAFPNAFLNVQVSLYDASVSSPGASITSTSQFSFTRDVSYGVSGFYWFAIGY